MCRNLFSNNRKIIKADTILGYKIIRYPLDFEIAVLTVEEINTNYNSLDIKCQSIRLLIPFDYA